MPTVFPKLVYRPTLSNRLTRVLNAPWIQRGYDKATMPIVCVKKSRLVPPLLSQLAPLFRVHNNSCHPVAYYRVHHHIKDGRGKRISLCQPALSLEFSPIVPHRSCNHCEAPLVYLEEPPGSGSHTVSL